MCYYVTKLTSSVLQLSLTSTSLQVLSLQLSLQTGLCCMQASAFVLSPQLMSHHQW